MRFELSQRFFFEAAHTLRRDQASDRAGTSRRIHGHTYRAKVSVAGEPDAHTGMVVDLARLRAAIDTVREQLDHQLLDDVPGLGAATLENLCGFIHRALVSAGWRVASVEVKRDATGDSCRLVGDA